MCEIGTETAKNRAQVERYCQGNGVDLGSGGDPVVPWAISVDLPEADAERYTSTMWGGPIHLRGDATDLRWFRDECLDWCYSSHLIEDFTQADQPRVLAEWGRVVRPGGYLIILYPENRLWAAAVAGGRAMNHNHQWEPYAGEIANVLREQGWEIVEDRLCFEGDFGWMTIGRKPSV